MLIAKVAFTAITFCYYFFFYHHYIIYGYAQYLMRLMVARSKRQRHHEQKLDREWFFLLVPALIHWGLPRNFHSTFGYLMRHVSLKINNLVLPSLRNFRLVNLQGQQSLHVQKHQVYKPHHHQVYVKKVTNNVLTLLVRPVPSRPANLCFVTTQNSGNQP